MVIASPASGRTPADFTGSRRRTALGTALGTVGMVVGVVVLARVGLHALMTLATLIACTYLTIVMIIQVKLPRCVRKLAVAGWSLKAVGVAAQHLWLLPEGNGGDALSYLDRGASVADALTGPAAVELREVPGTGVVDLVSGLMQTVVGRAPATLSLVFAWLAWAGATAFVKAAHEAGPHSSRRLRAIAAGCYFLPSMIIWPSVVGKDALLLAATGLFFYGFNIVPNRRPVQGIATMAVALLVAGLVRPHIGGLLLIASLISTLLGGSEARGARRSPVRRIAILVILVLSFLAAAPYLSSYVGADIASVQDVTSRLDQVANQTAFGGSGFAVSGSPLDMALVLFRPMPWEATTLVTLAAAAEGVLLLMAVTWALGRAAVTRSGRWRGRNAVFCAAYLAGFSFIFSHIGNFGLLARQRAQALPLVVTFLVLLLTASKRDRSTLARPEGPKET